MNYYRATLVYQQVNFIGEEAIDYGGPRREFFRLLAINFAKELMVGDNFKFMKPDVKALQVIYCSISIVLVMPFTFSFSFSFTKSVDLLLLLVLVLLKVLIYI